MKGALRLALLCACVTLAAMLSYSAAFAGDCTLQYRTDAAEAGGHGCKGKCGDPCPKCQKCCKEENPCICCVDDCGNPLEMTEGSCVTPPVARQGGWELDPCCCPPEQYTLCCTKAKYSSCFPREEFKLLCCAKKCCEDKCGCEKESKCGCENKCGCKKCCKKPSCSKCDNGCGHKNKCDSCHKKQSCSCGKCGGGDWKDDFCNCSGDKAEKTEHHKPLPDVLWEPKPLGTLPALEGSDEIEFGDYTEGPVEQQEERPIRVEGRG